MSAIRWTRDRWRQRAGERGPVFAGDIPAWVASLVIHVVVLLAMALVALPGLESTRRVISIVSPPAVEEPIVEPELIVEQLDQSGFGVFDRRDVDVTDAIAPTISEFPLVPVQVDDAVDPEMVVEEPQPSPSAVELRTFLEAGASGVGESGVGTVNTSGAVDRLTAEIATSLQQRSTLVCWVFDQSVSLAGQRQEIAGRLQRVFDELQAAEAVPSGREFTSLVFAYGQQVSRVLDEPTAEPDRVVRAIKSIPIDESGVEMTFSAIEGAAKTARRFRGAASRRNVMIMAFTDEVGDDQQKADAVTRLCVAQAMKVYVVGVPAPFGLGEVAVKFREFDPAYSDEPRLACVHQGPETLYPEVVRIRTGTEADEPMDSGFGPFSLSKLCAETGGIYFCVHPNRDARGRVDDRQIEYMSSQLRYFFDPEVMRGYRPNYLSASKIDELLADAGPTRAGSGALRALVRAARQSEIAVMESPRMLFPRQSDGALNALLTEAQKKSAVLQPKIDALRMILDTGLADRDHIQEKRWQAGYDLAQGRVLALKVRTDAYNIVLAQAKAGMKFKDPASDTWRLVPDHGVAAAGSQTEKLANQAKAYLTRVVAEHPGTPWAHLASMELRTPLGYRWEETRAGVNAPSRSSAGGGGGGRPRDDERRTIERPKPPRPLQNI